MSSSSAENPQSVINLSQIIDEQPLNSFSLLVFFLCLLSMVSDGYDLGVIGIGAPSIVKEFGISRAAMSPIFSAVLVGIFFGALGSGFIGDRMGRKRGIVLSCLIIGIATAACAVSHSFNQLLVFRFITGIGLGGLYPNTTAMLAEVVPARYRGALTAYSFMGITVGGILPGAISAAYVGDKWRTMLFIGSVIPLLLTPFLLLYMPESLKLLALKPRRKAELLKWLGKLCPGVKLSPDAQYVLSEKRVQGTAVAALFQGKLRLITPVLWLNFVAIMLANFFVNSYLTLVLRELGFSVTQAAGTASLFYVGGFCGGLIIGPAMDLMGPMILAIYAAIGIATAALLTIATGNHLATQALTFMMGFVVLASQLGLNAVVGMLYPTAVRSVGTGFAHSIGRIGAIGGPLIAGLLMAGPLDTTKFFLIPIAPFSVALACTMFFTWLWIGQIIRPEKMRRHIV